jgi:hypothetical protein
MATDFSYPVMRIVSAYTHVVAELAQETNKRKGRRSQRGNVSVRDFRTNLRLFSL